MAFQRIFLYFVLSCLFSPFQRTCIFPTVIIFIQRTYYTLPFKGHIVVPIQRTLLCTSIQRISCYLIPTDLLCLPTLPTDVWCPIRCLRLLTRLVPGSLRYCTSMVLMFWCFNFNGRCISALQGFAFSFLFFCMPRRAILLYEYVKYRYTFWTCFVFSELFFFFFLRGRVGLAVSLSLCVCFYFLFFILVVALFLLDIDLVGVACWTFFCVSVFIDRWQI